MNRYLTYMDICFINSASDWIVIDDKGVYVTDDGKRDLVDITNYLDKNKPYFKRFTKEAIERAENNEPKALESFISSFPDTTEEGKGLLELVDKKLIELSGARNHSDDTLLGWAFLYLKDNNINLNTSLS